MQRSASAQWSGDLKSGAGRLALGSGAFAGPYSFISRFQGSGDANPEELLGAAHAGCFSMAVANALSTAGHPPTSIDTTATVHLDKTETGLSITQIDLVTRGVVPGITAEQFLATCTEMKTGCIISRSLSAVPMTLTATLESA
jgi:lipoyl-dependent peroxiredoxin